MNRYFRALLVVALVFGLAGPATTAAVFAQTTAPAVAPTTTGTVQGTIHDNSGAPVANAKIILSGAQTKTTTSDATGAFSFTNITAGVYTLTASKAGYETAREGDLAVIGGQAETLAVVMPAVSFTSLRTIATVRAVGRGTFNVSPASVSVVSSQTFSLRGADQVMHVLDAVPGVQMSVAGNSVNGASPGGISFANIRAARSYETSSLIDGHPLFTGDYGDYVVNFLNPFLFNNVETVKGPGATVPQVNFALGGTVNFQTKEPTAYPDAQVLFGVGSYGGTNENISFSNTYGKLGVVAVYGNNNTGSAFDGKDFYFTNGTFYFNDNGQMSSFYANPTNKQPVPTTAGGNVFTTTATTVSAFGCCLPVNAFLSNQSELLKLRYKFSGATSLTFSYLGDQAHSDQFGNNGDVQYYTFQPDPKGPAYSGNIKPGTQIPVVFGYTSAFDDETNNEPILTAELHTTLGNDALIGRYYHAGIVRLQYQGPGNPSVPEADMFTFWGNQSASPKYGQYAAAFNGSPMVVQDFEYYRATEQDKLDGYSAEYQHPIGNDLLSLSFDWSKGQSASYSFSGSSKPGGAVPLPSVSIPEGSNQVFSTIMLRGEHHFSSKLNATLSLYSNHYQTTTNSKPQGGGTACNFDGTNCVFGTETSSHFDERLGIEWRPSYDWAVRLGAGSSIVPPYLGLLTAQTSSLPFSTTSQTTFLKFGTFKNPNLLPETAFGYDIGFDHRLPAQITMSFDGYLTNMFNGYFQQLVPTGFTCATPGFCSGQQAGNSSVPIYASYNANLSNARFEGLELDVRRAPTVGWGFDLAASTQRGYAYNLPPCFYSNVITSSGIDCTQYTTNLNIIAGQNFTGGANFMGVTNQAGKSLIGSTGISAQNQNVPYFTGNAMLSYAFANGVYAQIGDTLLGKNNSYNEPPFGIGYASLRFPVTKTMALQVSGDNIFNAYSGLFPVAGTGVPIPLAGGGLAATNANVVGPARYQLTLFFNSHPNP